MLLFRSEEHIQRWLAYRDLPPGATMSLEQCWRLAHAWYHSVLDPTGAAGLLRKHKPCSQRSDSPGRSGTYAPELPPTAVHSTRG